MSNIAETIAEACYRCSKFVQAELKDSDEHCHFYLFNCKECATKWTRNLPRKPPPPLPKVEK